MDNQDISYPIDSPVYGQSVLVTGGSGAFGQAFVKRCLADGARRVAVVSRGEAKQAAMRAAIPDDRLRFMIADVRDEKRMMDACRGVDIVVHSAALKRVEVCESEPAEAVATNIIGTQNVARACIERRVSKAVFLSTDKAASPATLYGATKLTAERLWIGWNNYSAGTTTRFSGTRYGNVANSTGSVIPLWQSQKSKGSLTLTNPAMSRFLMPMSAAVNLVMTALGRMRGGEIFVPRAGSATMGNLALAVDETCDWHIVGERPGEKLNELLISADESRYTHEAPDCYIIEPCSPLWESRAPLNLPKVPVGFEYASHTNPHQLDRRELQALVAA